MNKQMKTIGFALILNVSSFAKSDVDASYIQIDLNLIHFIAGEYKDLQDNYAKSLLDSLFSENWEWNTEDAWITKNLTLKPISVFREKKGKFFFFKSEWTKITNGKIIQFEDCLWIEKVGDKFSIIGRRRIFN